MHLLRRKYMAIGIPNCAGRIDSMEVIGLNIRKSSAFLYSACMIVLVMDTRTAVQGAAEGIEICIKSLIPSLFPFIIFSMLLTASLAGQTIKILRPIAEFCHIPIGAESLLAIGFLGGYPVGAQNVTFAWKKGLLNTENAQRMVVFCNNAGPAFVFGFLGQMFEDPIIPWILWLIQILSAILTGYLLPGRAHHQICMINSESVKLTDTLDNSLRVMARVCGWVVLFRILLEFLQKWIFWCVSPTAQTIITGILELSNGCLMLPYMSSDGLRLILASTFLGFGGICVLLQTQSISHRLPLTMYIPGKILQSAICFLLSYGAQFFLIPEDLVHISPYIMGIVFLSTLLSAVILRNIEKSVAISGDLLYNEK